ncbi:MAG: hypothetical protein CMM94_00885 [Rickettsiales bacterium]|nr:hypothetical protein [Rickettsiales bacterium]
MATYQWHSNSAVTGLTVERIHKYPTAFITASDVADSHVFETLPQKLQEKGWHVFADMQGSQPVLRVVGFEYDEEVQKALEEAGAVQGPATQTEVDIKEPLGLNAAKKWFKRNTVVASGLAYLVGDGLIVGSGLVRKDVNNALAGAAWGGTSVLLALFGTKDPQNQLENLYADLDDYLTEEQTDLVGAMQKQVSELKGNPEAIDRRIGNFISEHLIAINNIVFGLGGLNMAKAGMGQQNMFKAGAGAAVTGGMWGSLLIPEEPTAAMSPADKHAHEKAVEEGERPEEDVDFNPVDKHPGNYVEAFFQRKPLRLAGYGAGINNILMGISGWLIEMPEMVKQLAQENLGSEERAALQAKHRGALLDGMSPFAYLVANYIYSQAPKDRRGFLKEDGYLDELYTVAANILVEGPAEQRADRVEKFAEFLSTHEELKSTKQEIQEEITQKMCAIEKNPWRKGLQEKAQDNAKPSAEVNDAVMAGRVKSSAALQQGVPSVY